MKNSNEAGVISLPEGSSRLEVEATWNLVGIQVPLIYFTSWDFLGGKGGSLIPTISWVNEYCENGVRNGTWGLAVSAGKTCRDQVKG